MKKGLILRKSRRKHVDVSLVLPCFNEARVFEESINTILSVLRHTRFSWQLILVDDKSRDETAFLIKNLLKKTLGKHCKAIFHRYNMGRGRSVMDGIMASHATVVGYIDVDLEISPVYIPMICEKLLTGTPDIIIGKRIFQTNSSTIWQEIVVKIYQLFTNKMVDTGQVDADSGYKFFNRKRILPILKKTRHNRWFWDTEILVFARRAGLRIEEEPVIFTRRLDKTPNYKLIHDTREGLGNVWALWKRLL